MNRASRKDFPGFAAFLASSLIWGLLILLPLLMVLVRAVHFSSRWLDPEILAIVRLTAVQAFVSTAFSVLIGLPLGLAVARLSNGKLRWARTLLALPYSVPTVVAGAAWIAWLGRSGFLGTIWERLDLHLAYSWFAIVLAHVFYNAPWVALLIAESRAAVPASRLEAAQTLGARRAQLFLRVVWPEIRWALGAAMAQVFSLCVMSFALVLLLGGGPPVQTLETALFARIRYGTLDLEGAAICGLWELLLTLPPWILVLWFRRRESGTVDLGGRGTGTPVAGGRFLLALCAVFLIPYFATVPALSYWFEDSRAVRECLRPLRMSLLLAFGTGVGAVWLGASGIVAAEYLRKRNPAFAALFLGLMGLPSGVSILVLGLGVWLAYSAWMDPFAGNLWAMVALQIAAFYPLTLRMFFPLMGDGPARLVDAAATLGATRWQVFCALQWPRWKMPVFSAFAIVVGASLGEVAAVSLFFSEKLLPLPVLLSRWMAQYRFEDAQALTALLLILSLGATTLASAGARIGRFRKWTLD